MPTVGLFNDWTFLDAVTGYVKGLPGAPVHFYNPGTTTYATRYDSAGNNPASGVFSLNSEGNFDLYAVPGPYDVKINGTTHPIEVKGAIDPTTVTDARMQAGLTKFDATTFPGASAREKAQAALDAAVLAGGGDVVLAPSADWTIASPGLKLPTATPSRIHAELKLSGLATEVKSTVGAPFLTRDLPVDMTEASIQTNWRFTLEGLRFVGNNTPGQKVMIPCSYGTVVKRCGFIDTDGGLDLIFALMARVEECFGNSNTARSFAARSGAGLWSGATAANTPSNMTKLVECRDYCSTGQTESFYVEGSSGVELDGCISEGLNPVRNVTFVHSGVGRDFKVRNFHNENIPTDAVISAPAFNRVTIEALFLHGSVNRVLDMDGSVDGSVVELRDIPFWPATARLRHSTTSAFGLFWIIGNVGTPSVDLSDRASTYWDGAPTFSPYHLIQIRMDGSGAETGSRHPVIATPYLLGIKTGEFKLIGAHMAFQEKANPGLAPPNTAYLWAQDNGAGKTQLVAIFPSGAAQVLATEP